MSTTSPEFEESKPSVEQILSTYTIWDTSTSFLYKQAISLQVPVRYVLVQPKNTLGDNFLDAFDLSEHRDSNFTTVFAVIRNLKANDNNLTLNNIWNIISQFAGSNFKSSDMVYIWLYALYSQNSENIPDLYQEILDFWEATEQPNRGRGMTGVLQEYLNSWYPRLKQEYERDSAKLVEFINSQIAISNIKPIKYSELVLDSITISYDYEAEPGIDMLADIFNTSKTSYIIPFIQYNAKKNTLGNLENLENLERYYRIYKGRSVDLRPNYTNVSLSSAQTNKGRTIYLNVWTGAIDTNLEQTQERARHGRKESYRMITVSYIENTEPNKPGLIRVTIASPHNEYVNEKVIIDRIHSHLPGLPKPSDDMIVEKQIGGNFVMYNVDLIEAVLFDLIMNNPLFSSYLYIEESVKSFAEKSRLNLYFQGASAEVAIRATELVETKNTKRSAVAATIVQDWMKAGDKLNVIGQTELLTLERDIPVIKVRVTRATSRKIAGLFIEVLSRLMKTYTDTGLVILNEYYTYVPEYQKYVNQRITVQEKTTAPPESKRKGAAKGAVLAKLQKEAGEIFVEQAARKCQKDQQPLIIKREEIPYWKTQKIQRPGYPDEDRQVLSFPKKGHPGFPEDQEPYYFVCPGKVFMYPGLRAVKGLKNNDIFKVIPCCYKRPHTARPNSVLNKYLRNEEIFSEGKGKTRNHQFSTNKIAHPGRSAMISSVLTSFLLKIEPNSKFLRLGVPLSNNSFIHCVARALDSHYQRLLTIKEQNEYAQHIRINLISQLGILPSLMKQELFDMTSEDIINTLLDPESFFDPALYFRALEECYNCNIYVFGLDQDQKQASKMSNKLSLLQLPRHKHFHVRPLVPHRQVLLLICHLGTESNALKYPQCELIVRSVGDKSQLVYDNRMNNYIYPALNFVARTLTWQITNTIEGPSLSCRSNIYSAINYNIIFGQIPILAQLIDGAGKARCFALAPEMTVPIVQGQTPDYSKLSNLRIFVNVPPTAPLNRPEFKPEEASPLLPHYEKILELFGDPVSVTTSSDNIYLTGLWFPIGDIQFGFYCPCEDFLFEQFLKRFPEINNMSELAALTVYIPRKHITPLDVETSQQLIQTISPIQRLKKLRRAGQFIEQIFKYLYVVAKYPKNIMKFIQGIGTLIPPENLIDSAIIYDVSNIPRILPRADPTTSVHDIMTELAKTSPNLFSVHGKFLFYDLKMYAGLVNRLNRFAQSIDGLNIAPSQLREIKDYFSSKEDFKFNPVNEYILSSIIEYNNWSQIYVPSASIQQRTTQNLKDNVQTKLNPHAFAYQEPYIYQHSEISNHATSFDPTNDRFYIIQNVIGGDFLSAIQIAYNWYTKKLNTGFPTSRYDITENKPIPVHIIYKFSEGGGIRVKDDRSGKNSQYLEILDYGIGQGTYAAMLRIL